MPVDDPTKIDALGIERDTGMVVLTIADHLDWSDMINHFDLLENKINAYMDFVVGGQLREEMPDADGRQTKIAVYLKYDPPSEARATLNAVTEKLAARGVTFWFGPLPEGH